MRHPEIETVRSKAAAFATQHVKNRQTSKGSAYISLPDTEETNNRMEPEYEESASRALFGGFWHEGELCILFANTGMGKSVLAVQIGDSLAKCCSIGGPFLNHAEESLRVLYIDFEHTAKQFQSRYTHPGWGTYVFGNNFYRAELNPEAWDSAMNKNYEQRMKNGVEAAVLESRARVLIIDSITYLCSGTGQAKYALPLMNALRALKIRYDLSILVLAQTPKRNARSPLTINDLQGSKTLINFADSAFAIGQSRHDAGLRYLKQIKQRSRQEQYGEDNVCLVRQERLFSFLGYRFGGCASESSQLCRTEGAVNAPEKQKILELHRQGFSLRQIGNELGIHYTTVGRIVRAGNR